ncbi:hypothetical protein BN1723_020508, partial [Verticillium longisporum]
MRKMINSLAATAEEEE